MRVRAGQSSLKPHAKWPFERFRDRFGESDNSGVMFFINFNELNSKYP